MSSNRIKHLVSTSFLASTMLAGAAFAQEKLLRIGMTAADIPRTHGQPDQGFEGNRFTGIPMFDSLTQWDLWIGRQGLRHHPGPCNAMGRGCCR